MTNCTNRSRRLYELGICCGRRIENTFKTENIQYPFGRRIQPTPKGLIWVTGLAERKKKEKPPSLRIVAPIVCIYVYTCVWRAVRLNFPVNRSISCATGECMHYYYILVASMYTCACVCRTGAYEYVNVLADAKPLIYIRIGWLLYSTTSARRLINGWINNGRMRGWWLTNYRVNYTCRSTFGLVDQFAKLTFLMHGWN